MTNGKWSDINSFAFLTVVKYLISVFDFSLLGYYKLWLISKAFSSPRVLSWQSLQAMYMAALRMHTEKSLLPSIHAGSLLPGGITFDAPGHLDTSSRLQQ